MRDEIVAEELGKATEALEDARKMRAADVSDEAVVGRLYYACFHAANAVLYDRGFEPSSHQGTLSLFGQELVLDGQLPRDDGRFLTRLRDLREQADYGYDSVDEDVGELLDRSEAFVRDLEDLVE